MSEDQLFLECLNFTDSTNSSPSAFLNILLLLKSNQSKIEKLFQDSERTFLFFNNFCFDKLVNITFLDTTMINLSVDLLDYFTNYNEFFEVADALSYTMEFILLTLLTTKTASEEILLLLKLLSKILSRGCQNSKQYLRNLDQQRILEVILTVAKIENVDLIYFNYYGPIINYLLEIQFPDSLNKIIADLFEILRKYNAARAMAIICEQAFKKYKFDRKALNPIFLWLMEEATDYLSIENQEAIPEIINCLARVASTSAFKRYCNNNYSWTKSYCALTQNFIDCISTICYLSSDTSIRASCMQILEYTITIYFGSYIESFLSSKQQLLIRKELLLLPVNVEDWPHSNNNIFFLIYHIGFLKDSFIWEKTDVLNSVMKCFYTKQYIQQPYLLKTIVFLYSHLIDGEDLTEDLKMFGSDLIATVEEYSLISFACTHTSVELKWIFGSDAPTAKIKLFVELLNDGYDETDLITIVKTNNIQLVLISIILSQEYKAFAFRCAMLLNKTRDKQLAQKIVQYLLLRIEDVDIFLNLLVANPGVPSTEEKAVIICTVLGALLSSIDDKVFLKYACLYSTKVLASLHNTPKVLTGFCKNTSNFKYLIKIAGEVEDEVFDAIITLLKVVISLQQKHSVKIEPLIEADFSSFLHASPDKNEESLKFIKVIMSYKMSFIKMDLKNVFEIFWTILHFANIPNKNTHLFNDCLKLFLHKVPSLSYSNSTSSYMKMMYTKSLSKKEASYFLEVLYIWVTSLEANNGFAIVDCSVDNILAFVKKSCTDFRMASQFEKLLNKIRRKMWMAQSQRNHFSKNYFSSTRNF